MCVLPIDDPIGGWYIPARVSFLFLIVVDHTLCSIVSKCKFVFSLVVLYSFLCSSPIPPPCLIVLLTVSILTLLLLFRSLVFIHALSSSVFFSQVSVSMMKSMFSSSIVPTICCCLFFIDLAFIVAILMLFELFFFQLYLFVLGSLCTPFCFSRYLFLCFLAALHLFNPSSPIMFMVSKGRIQY